MYPELIFFAIFSAVLLFGFIALGVIKFGLQPAYSSYSALWGNAVPINNMNLWSIVTLVAAFLICPVMLQVGAASTFQFLGFMVPIYLMVVSLTPNWFLGGKEFRVHYVCAIICMVCAILWMLVVMHALKIVIGTAIFVLALALFTGTLKSSDVFWLEMYMFLSVYVVILFAII